MLKGPIARRYAGAIFELAQKQHALDRTLEDVKGIAQVFSNRKLAYLLQEPKIPAQSKEMALRKALTSKVLPTSLNLALLIVQRGLVDVMPRIATELEALVLDHYNQAKADVTIAAKLDQAQSDRIKQALEGTTGKNIIMHTRIDPSILGGLIARVGDQIIDSSVRYRLHALQQQLLAGASIAKTEDFFSDEEGLELVDTSV
jgi:F-type H+-transporting ATPase subunit delta